MKVWLLLAGMLVSACGDDMAAVAFSLRAARTGSSGLLAALILGGVAETEQGRAWAAFRWIVTIALLAGYVLGGLLGARHAVTGLALSGLTAVLLGLGAALGRPRPGRAR